MQELIRIYGASWCPDCRRAKRFLGDQRVPFEWHDIEVDPDGVRIVQDKELMEFAKDHKIPLEVCLTSNYQSGVAPSLDQHPLRELYEAGLATTINTDDPSVSAINLTDEFVVAMEHLKFNLDILREHVMNAAEAAFLPPDEKKQLVSRLNGMLYPQKLKATVHSRS